ncbi:MAG: hypothetical protein IJJ88_03710 [Oscillospiraceae bacterium]|nr:hypothetical protein [Oscillospiraceae bacterium]
MQNHNDHRYDDIIRLDRPVSSRHAPMPRQSRAAQFSPFAALTGYDDAIAETERLTTPRIELDDSQRALISDKLSRLRRGDAVSITYFVYDEYKSGGAYVTVSGPVKTVDPVTHTVTMQSGAVIPMEDILTLTPQP